MGRNTQGVTLIRLSKGEKLQAVERLDASLESDDGGDDEGTAAVVSDTPETSPEA